MKNLKIILILSVLGLFSVQAQHNLYKPERTKINDLVHTKLKVSFDFAKREMPAEAWLTLKPHFYPTNKLVLDAKAMQIDAVLSNGKKLEYDYDGKQLKIILNNTYSKTEEYTIHIKYIAKPEDFKNEGSAAITNEKGLYFIDPDGTNPDVPTEIWTQGETESSSVWFPTIDSSNQKSTQEIYMTVANKYVTLSNGLLISQTENDNGTRTDYWKMDQKHAPYLFFMGVGEFSVIHDFYKDKPVDYYVDKEYEPYAKEIFGNTPEMMQFFSDVLGVEFPWSKYAQMVAYEYVSGAMENTTATLHADKAYQISGELIDQNVWEDTIAHELFHQWFGNLVTAESWSNLTVNESFANYSEYLWREYKYGKDHADAHRNNNLFQYYFLGANDKKNLVRFNYTAHMDMFDSVSYNKGGGILHMLRNYLGDKAFFAGLKEYLETNKFGTGEAHQLRLALEKVSGRDLNQFFNQWYFGSGHPILDITYGHDNKNKQATVLVKQSGKVFNFPVKINVYENTKPKTYEVWVNKAEQSFAFKTNNEPKLIDFDVDKTLISVVTDNKTVENYIFQYNNAPSYENRKEAIEKLTLKKDNKKAVVILKQALNDPYFRLRILAIKNIDLNDKNFKSTIDDVKNIIRNDSKTLVKATAINALSAIAKKNDITLFENSMQSKSYSVKTNALNAIYKIDKAKALSLANKITNKLDKKSMKDALINIYINENDESQYLFLAKHSLSGMFMSSSSEKQQLYGKAVQLIMKSDDAEVAQVFVNNAVKIGNQFKQYGSDKMLLGVLDQFLQTKKESKSENKQTLISIIQKGIERLK